MTHTQMFKQKNRIRIAIFSILLIPFFSQAKDPKEEGLTQRQKFMIDSVVKIYLNEGNFSGIVTLAEQNEVVYNKAYGWANKQLKVANTIDTKSEIGSMSKQFCAVLVLMAVNEGLINEATPLSTYLPYTSQVQSGLGTVTIKQLLDMQSGIPSYDNFPNFITTLARQNMSLKDFVMTECGYPIAPPPGTAFGYCDGNYYVLGVVLEKVYHKPYADILQEKIFDRLNMRHSGFFKGSGNPSGGEVVKNLNNGYQQVIIQGVTPLDAFGLAIDTTHYLTGAWTNMSDIAYASGAIYMTGEDFIKWTKALNEHTLLPARLQAEMFTPWSNNNVLQNYYPNQPNCDSTGYGYAMVIVNRPEYPASSNKCMKIWTHGGLTPGYSSVGAMLPDQGKTVFITSNTNSDAPLFMCWQIINIMMNYPINWHVPY